MNILNVHERTLTAPATKVGELLDRLASPGDQIWPTDRWPAMRFDRPLAIGAKGGHGPIRYFVEDYRPGQSILFRFTGPKGFKGTHALEVVEVGPDLTQLRHVLEMRTVGRARLTWPLFFRPLHDALIEDGLDRAEAHLAGQPLELREWPSRVKWLRRMAERRQSKAKASRRLGPANDIRGKHKSSQS